MMTDNENTSMQDHIRTHIEKQPKAPSVKTVVIGYLLKAPVCICVCALESITFFYLQHVFVAISNVANYRHVC